MGDRARWVWLGVAATAAIVASCRAPTELTVLVTTDMDCGAITGTSVTVGRLDELDGKSPTTTSSSCDKSGNLGSLVIVPSGSETDEVAVKVVAGVGGRDPASCVPPYGHGCIIARRAIRFVPHSVLRIAVPLRAACNGITCAADATCVSGVCMSAVIGDPSACADASGCGEGSLGPPPADEDGGASVAGPDAGAEAGVDATLEAGGDAGLDAAFDAGLDAGDAAADVVAFDAGPGLPPAMGHVSGGYAHTCAITAGGAVKCWGYNSNGQLGTGAVGPDVPNAVAVVGFGSGVAQVTAGYVHTCILTSAGAVSCWGDNGDYQMGDGTNTIRPSPVPITGLGSGIAAIASGPDANHTCAASTGGNLTCWGSNSSGQITNPPSSPPVPSTPVSLSKPKLVVALGAAASTTCAVVSGGAAQCWGDNSTGEVGDGTTTTHNAPATVSNLANAAFLSGGGGGECALTSAGGVKCWGANGSGQIGDGTTVERNAPVDVVGLTSGVIAVTVGTSHACALLSTGGVKCWGDNTWSQLGDGTTTARSTPVDVVGLASGVVSIGAGHLHTCAILSTGAAQCWGGNFFGQLGDGTFANRATPVAVKSFP